MCGISYLKQGVPVIQVSVPSKHLLIPCCYISNRPFSDFISFSLKKTKWCPCPFCARNKLTWIKINVRNMKKTSILPRASACLSKAIWILLHCAHLVQSHPKSISVKQSSLERRCPLPFTFLQLCTTVLEMCHHFPKISLYCPASPVFVSLSSLCSIRLLLLQSYM